VLVESSAAFALTNEREVNHQQARAIRERLIRKRWRLCTTNFSLAETHVLVLIRLGREVATTLVYDMAHRTTTMTRVTEAGEGRARERIDGRLGNRCWSSLGASARATLQTIALERCCLRILVSRRRPPVDARLSPRRGLVQTSALRRLPRDAVRAERRAMPALQQVADPTAGH
jgi:hypothetical protein